MSIGYLTRLHVNLIDMRNMPDNEYKWILHTKDHFTKFSWAYPLASNEAEDVAEQLLRQFHSFGTPCILESNKDKQFVDDVIRVGSLPCVFLGILQ